MSHTPGPWAISLSADARVDDRITGVNGAPVIRGSIVNTLDAALIAAAPDLLAALREIVDHFHRTGDPTLGDMAPRARAAIARATGEA